MKQSKGGFLPRRVVVPGFRTATLISLPHRAIVERLGKVDIANSDEPETGLLEYGDDPTKPAIEAEQK